MTDGRNTDEPREEGAAGDIAAPPSEAPPDTLPPADEATPVRAQSRAWIWWVAIIVVLVLALVGSAPFWTPLLPWADHGGTGAEMAALEARLAAAETARQSDEQRLARLEQAPAPQSSAALAVLSDRVAALEHGPSAQPPDISADLAPLQDQLQQLSGRLDAVESQLKATDARVDTLTQAAANGVPADRFLLLGLMQLRSAAATSSPFQGELAAVEALARDRPPVSTALAPLESVAATGIPSTAVLAERFANETAPAILQEAATAPDPNAGLGQRILARIESLVVIHRVDANGAPSGDPVASAVAQAQAALAKGDLAGAVDALGALPAQDAAAANSWLDAARRRLAVEKTLAGLVQQAAADLAHAASAAPDETR